MDYISNVTEFPLSKLFYKPLQNAIFSNLGLILLYKIDIRNTLKISQLHDEVLNYQSSSKTTLPIIEDFVSLILDKNIKNIFWKMFGDLQLNEKDFLLHELNIIELANFMGKEYLLSNGSLEEIDLELARNIFFNFMLRTYFDTTALGSINKLNLEWNNHQPSIKQFQSQIIAKYLNKFQPKKLEAIKVDELMEVSEYIE